jgi:hypothetical protein
MAHGNELAMESIEEWRRKTEVSARRSQERRAQSHRQFPLSLWEAALLLVLVLAVTFSLLLIF